MRHFDLKILAVVAGMVALPAAAADFDGSANLICSSISTVSCAADSECIKGTAESADVPQFFLLDFKKRIVNAKRPDGTELSAQIVNQSEDKSSLFVQGVENALGWSMAITKSHGKMVITAAGEGGAFVVFGACMASP
jgi:hypothetical protein